ncbi:MAG TPA: thiolase family protein [Acidimicrobiales bacterium]|nr:thiolase family protein [Acidimicrobiales bacterium]
MGTAVIVDTVRTACGRRNGKLAGWHSTDLAAAVLRALLERNDLDPAEVDDVVMGCVMQVGEQSLNVARNAVLAAGMPESVPGTTVDRQCGSSQQAVHFAAQSVMAGACDVLIAAGVESMTRVPMGISMQVVGAGMPFGPAVLDRYKDAGGLVPQGVSAELMAERWRLSRGDLDDYAAGSQQRAVRARDEGRFLNEILPVAVRDQNGHVTSEIFAADEGIRQGTTAEVLAGLKPAFTPGGVVTAGNSSQISDGAAAVLVMSEGRCAALGLVPRARLCAFALAGVDPVLMLSGPIPATRRVLERAKLTMDDIDLFEVNEAFASVVLAWAAELRPDMDRVNVNGGAIALGHPIGASGTRLLATLVNELERTDGRYGLQVMCTGGGQATALIVERVGGS